MDGCRTKAGALKNCAQPYELVDPMIAAPDGTTPVDNGDSLCAQQVTVRTATGTDETHRYPELRAGLGEGFDERVLPGMALERGPRCKPLDRAGRPWHAGHLGDLLHSLTDQLIVRQTRRAHVYLGLCLIGNGVDSEPADDDVYVDVAVGQMRPARS
jgi:hypothetical protein